jgi:SAM-dependent MidA family methyltransferase
LSKVDKRIAEEIRDRGAITFARFMELALYCPNCGYYEREEDILGRQGDYYTSVSVGSLFGELLAFQFAEWLEPREEPPAAGIVDEGSEVKRLVEAGAHGGDLALDILRWMRERRPRLFSRLEYWIVEPSATRQQWQRRKLVEFGDKLHWVNNLVELTGKAAPESHAPGSDGLRGILFSNELLDAMPIHRLGWDAQAREWFEWGVTLQAEGFGWCRIPRKGSGSGGLESEAALPSSHPQVFLGNGLSGILPDGFTLEVCPAAEQWWRKAALALGCGKLLTIDYGLTAEEFFAPERREGTVRSYRRHRSSSDVLTDPGERDITAHVNFTAIQTAGESAGLKTDALVTQAQFLTQIAARTWNDEAVFGNWTPERIRQFQTLTHPEHLGRPFRVLLQSRG